MYVCQGQHIFTVLTLCFLLLGKNICVEDDSPGKNEPP